MEKLFHIRLFGEKVQISGDADAVFGNDNAEVYARWNWNSEKLTAANDRYGFYPLYYIADETEFLISSSVGSLLEAKPNFDFDEAAMSVFLRLGWLVGEDTIFRQIRALPPECVLTWQHGKLQISPKPRKIYQPLNIPRREAMRTYAELFQKAVEKNLPPDNDFIVPLSGGRDSRHILLALAEANRKPAACVTLLHPPPRPNEDAKIAAQICLALKIEHRLLEQTSSRFDNEYRKNEITGYGTDEHGWFMPLADFIKNTQATVYDGIAGDVLSAGLFLNEKRLNLFAKENFKELADDILLPEGYLPKLLTGENYERFSRAKAISRITREIEKHAAQPNAVGSFYFFNRTRRCVALNPFRLFGNTIVKTPFLDAAVFDFLSSLPAQMFTDHKFHTETIASAYPEFSQIPYEKKDFAPDFDAAGFRRYSREIWRYSFSRRRRKLLNPAFLHIRFMRSQFDKNYCREIAGFGAQAIFLMQLERL